MWLFLAVYFSFAAAVKRPQTCVNKHALLRALTLPQCSKHSDSARFAQKARAKRLHPHVWTLVKASRAFVHARRSRGFSSLFIFHLLPRSSGRRHV
jgi:hypothetical protein